MCGLKGKPLLEDTLDCLARELHSHEAGKQGTSGFEFARLRLLVNELDEWDGLVRSLDSAAMTTLQKDTRPRDQARSEVSLTSVTEASSG